MASHPDTPTASSRDRLLRAAKRLFAAQGYEQTATSAIAREAGTSESQLMRYFGGKVGVLEALFDDSWSDLNRRVARDAESNGTAHERILAVTDTLVAALARDPDLATLLLFEGRRLRGEKPHIRVSTGFLSFAKLVRGLIKEGQATGEFDPALDPVAVTSALVGAAEAMVRDRLQARGAGGRSFAEREVRRTLDAMLSGFTPPTAGRTVRSGRASKRR
jgi:AcrR family transcriptional regulator